MRTQFDDLIRERMGMGQFSDGSDFDPAEFSIRQDHAMSTNGIARRIPARKATVR